ARTSSSRTTTCVSSVRGSVRSEQSLLCVNDATTVRALGETMREPIAIVGVALRFPGGVTSLGTLRDLLEAARSGIIEVPADRWSADALYHPEYDKPGYIHVRRGGFLGDIEGFDASFFSIA